ncbi:MAG: hypothetical protein BGO39_05655 [Chloroflexi bacterium 54-19]|nr:MAG: hypothetical protein BGO39_05655 [Chloroflexi bacterium 54-19]
MVCFGGSFSKKPQVVQKPLTLKSITKAIFTRYVINHTLIFTWPGLTVNLATAKLKKEMLISSLKLKG